MTPKDFYAYITKFMTPEQALMKMLEGSLIQYDKLKFTSQQEAVHPEIIIAMAAMDLGWSFALEKKEGTEPVRGMTIGTMEYLDTVFPKKEDVKV